MPGGVIKSEFYKTWSKKTLVLLLLVSLIFASYWQFFAVQKAKAQVTPPGPTNQPISANFVSKERQQIIIQQVGSATKYTFSNQGEKTFDEIKGMIPADKVDQIKGQTQYFRYNFSGDSANPNILYLIVGGTTSWLYLGLYTSASNAITSVGSPTFITGNFAAMPIASQANTTLFPTTEIKITGDTATNCSNLKTLWQSTQSDIALLLDKDAKDNPYWAAVNPTGTDVGRVIDAYQIYQKISSGPVVGFFGSGFTEWFQKKIGAQNKGYYLNSAGNEVAIRVQQSIDELIAITNSVKQNNDTWPSQCQKPQKMGANFKFTGEFVEKPSEFINGLYALKQAFITAITNAGAPVADQETCGNFLRSFTGGLSAIFNGMFCSLALFIHDAAAWGMDQARTLLISFVGVKINFSEVDTVDVFSPAPTGGAGATPATPTPNTTGLNLAATITFSKQANYNKIKANPTGITVTIGQSGTDHRPTGTTFAGTANCANLNDSAKTAVCTTTASQTIPTPITQGAALGKIGTTEVFLINFTNNSTSVTDNDRL